MRQVLHEIQEGHLDKALEFARQINLPMERYCALDDVLEAYALKGDIENYLIMAGEFNSRENLCFSATFSLSDLANFIILNQQLIPENEFNKLKNRLRKLCD